MITLVTGGAQGIGWATAELLASEGHKICIFDIAGAEEAAARFESEAVFGFTGDVTKVADVDNAIAAMIDRFGSINCVVTSAGIVKVAPALDVEVGDFEQTLATNVTGSFLPAQRAARVMAKNGGGNIIFIGSVYGSVGAPQRTAYCASKGAVHLMTQSLAIEWGPLGIRVNSVAPTGTRTPMIQDLIDRGVYKLKAVEARTPLGRLAEPNEVAAAVSFLASPQASMVNGIILPVDGGWIANGYIV
jgi:NAD(P)-dependent dehydrogenase (short-subunit alcohol dehydrogenase family)